jgi:hypothetical protein
VVMAVRVFMARVDAGDVGAVAAWHELCGAD